MPQGSCRNTVWWAHQTVSTTRVDTGGGANYAYKAPTGPTCSQRPHMSQCPYCPHYH